MVKFCKSQKCLVGKVAIVTGANTGIGYATALDLAKRGCRVILACRNQEKAEATRKKIAQITGNQNVAVKIVKLDLMDSVRQFARTIKTTETRLDILVNNAGAASLPDKITPDGLQMEMAVNYFSHFLLTNLLLDLLKKSAPSRVVNVSSFVAQMYGSLKVEQLNKHEGDFMLYCKTKLCNILFTQELAVKLKGSGITTYSVHPGGVHTNMLRLSSPLSFLSSIFFKTPEEGAQTTLYVALEDGIEEYSGEHFEDCKPIVAYDNTLDGNARKKLWALSAKMVGLNK